MEVNNLRAALRLYAITDRHWLDGDTLEHQVELAIKGGATIIQFREKSAPDTEREALALKVQDVCRRYNVPFIINDDVELTKKINADGVHVGQEDRNILKARAILGKNKIIGVSSHNVQEAVLAQKQGADYLGCGAVFATSSKDNVSCLPLKTLKEICACVQIPVVAIGGINLDNIELLRDTGIAGAAVISAIFGAENIEQAARDLRAKLNN